MTRVPLVFLHPLFFWLLLPALCLFILFVLSQQRKKNWSAICDPHLLAAVLKPGSATRQFWPMVALGLAWLSAIIGLSGPSVFEKPNPIYRSAAGEVIALDASPTMLSTDLLPNRLQRAQYKVIDFLRQVEGVSVGMIAFSAEAYTVSPLTEDARTISDMVPDVNPAIMPVSGSNISAALNLAEKLLEQGGAEPRRIVLVTASNPSASDLELAKKISAKNIQIDVLAVGSAEGAPLLDAKGNFVQDKKGQPVLARLDLKSLQTLSQISGGRFVKLSTDDSDIQQLQTWQLQVHTAQQALSKQSIAQRVDSGYWFIFISLFILLLIFRRGWLEEYVK